jgi:hypothetical protein
MTYAEKSSGFQTLKNSKKGCKCDRVVLFFAGEKRYTSQSLDFPDSAQA